MHGQLALGFAYIQTPEYYLWIKWREVQVTYYKEVGKTNTDNLRIKMVQDFSIPFCFYLFSMEYNT